MQSDASGEDRGGPERKSSTRETPAKGVLDSRTATPETRHLSGKPRAILPPPSGESLPADRLRHVDGTGTS